jgi:multidrug efflux system membrane fusion protein
MGERRLKRLPLAALLLVLLACGYFFRGYFFETTGETRTAARPAAAQLVVADVAVHSPTPILVTAIGTVQSIATMMVKSRVDGEIAKVHFEEGQEVKGALVAVQAPAAPKARSIPVAERTP